MERIETNEEMVSCRRYSLQFAEFVGHSAFVVSCFSWISEAEIRLSDHVFHDIPHHIGEPEVAAIDAIRELLVIEPEERENRRMEIVRVHLVLGRARAEFIGRSVDRPAL